MKYNYVFYLVTDSGEMAEWPKAPDLKSGDGRPS